MGYRKFLLNKDIVRIMSTSIKGRQSIKGDILLLNPLNVVISHGPKQSLLYSFQKSDARILVFHTEQYGKPMLAH